MSVDVTLIVELVGLVLLVAGGYLLADLAGAVTALGAALLYEARS